MLARKRQTKGKGSRKEKQKEEREKKKAEKMAATKKEKMPTQEASVKSTNEKTRKGKGKATIKDTRYVDTCPICMQLFQKLRYNMGDWIECHCKQWIHEDSINYVFTEPLICPKCITNKFCSVTYNLCFWLSIEYT